MRINGAIIPPGLIRSAKTYTLIFKDNKLYILNTGPAPASQKIYSAGIHGLRQHKGLLENAAIGAVVKRIIAKVQAGEKRIDESDIDELVKEKNNFLIGKEDIVEVVTKKSAQDIRLIIKTTGKNFKFDCMLDDCKLVEELAAILLR